MTTKARQTSTPATNAPASTAPAPDAAPVTSAPGTISASAVEIPKGNGGQGRKPIPNPYAELVKELAGDREHARQITFTNVDVKAREEAVKAAGRFLNRAGDAEKVTVRKAETTDGDSVVLTVWAVDKVTRKSAKKDSGSGSESADK